MDGKNILLDVSSDAASFGAGFGNPGCRDERIRVPEGSAFDGRGGAAAHLSEVIALRFGIMKHCPGESPIAGDVARIVTACAQH